MIKFFRKIRYDLMEQNKTGKYLKYAIGEVVLVVVGILIALSINNWNEGRKTKAIEIKVLTDIKKALISDLDNQFTYQLERIQNFKSHSATILELIEQKSPYDDSLNIRFEVLTSAGRTYWSPQITAYKQLESKGLDLIRNDSLQLAILNIYNHQYLRIETLFENYKQNIYDYGRPFARRNFKNESW